MTTLVSRFLGAAWIGLSAYAAASTHARTESYLAAGIVACALLGLMMWGSSPLERAAARADQRRKVRDGASDIGRRLHLPALELVTVGMREDALRILRPRLGPGSKPDEFLPWLGLEWMTTFELSDQRLSSITLWAETPDGTAEHIAHLLSRLNFDRVEQDGTSSYVYVRGALITLDGSGGSTSVRIESRRG